MSIPGAASPLFIGAAAGAAAAYQIDRSLRFNSGDDAYLNKTPSSAGDRKRWTWAAWVKRSALGSPLQILFEAKQDGNDYTALYFTTSDELKFEDYSSNTLQSALVTDQLFRDVSSFYHIVVAVDTTQATASNRTKIYVNGSQVTSFSTETYIPQNNNTYVNSTQQHRIGDGQASNQNFNGYLAEVHLVDGQQLAASDFGEYDSNNVWQPKEYSGDYNYSTGTVYSASSSGMSNPGLMFDGDTSTSPSLTADGTVYTMLTGVSISCSSSLRINANANNFQVSVNGGSFTSAASVNSTYLSLSVPSGNTLTSLTFKDGAGGGYGVRALEVDGTVLVDGSVGANGFYLKFADNSSDAALGTDSSGNSNTWTVNNLVAAGAGISNATSYFDIVTYTGNGSTQTISGLNFQPDLVWIKNRSSTYQNLLFDSVRGATKYIKSDATSAEQSNSNVLTSFNSDGFTLGNDNEVNKSSETYVAWCWKAGSSNTSVSAGSLNSSVYNQSQTWSSSTFFDDNGHSYYNSGGTITKLFDNDLGSSGSNGVWILPVDGGTFELNFTQFSSATTVTFDLAGTGNALKINGSFVTIPGSGSETTATYNVSGLTKIEWLYNGGSNYCYLGSIKVDGIKLVDSGVSVTNVPSIASTTRANNSSGFSIVSYTGNSSISQTVAHSLSTAPELIIVKNTDYNDRWGVFHTSVGGGNTLVLNSTTVPTGGTGVWGNTSPDSSVFTISNDAEANRSGSEYIAYCFAPVSGFSKFGSYTGNGSSTGPVITTGFKPKFVLLRNISRAEHWIIYDSVRGNFTSYLLPNDSSAEGSFTQPVIALADGFQLGDTRDLHNRSGDTYIYAAFAGKPDGTVIDSLIDTPTNYTADSGNNGGNYATWNPLQKYAAITLSNGNLDFTDSNSVNGGDQGVHATIAPVSGKFYWEMTLSTLASENYIGISKSSKLTQTLWTGGGVDGYYYYNIGKKIGGGNGNGGETYGASFGVGDVIGVAVDWDNGKVTFYKNGVSQGDAFTGKDLTGYVPAYYFNTNQSSAGIVNFGQRPFEYTPPTGYVSLCTQNLSDPTIPDGSTAFDAKLYTGNASTQSVSLNFGPDLLWLKSRSASKLHALCDSVRGDGQLLYSNSTLAEQDIGSSVVALASSGFNLGYNSGYTAVSHNHNNESLVAWAWDAGTSTVSNTDGSITTSVRASQTNGFSIITYTGNGTSGATIGHSLNAEPYWVIVKPRNGTTTYGWRVYHKSSGNTKHVRLDTTSAESVYSDWNNTTPTSSVITLDGSPAGTVNESGTDYLCLAWAPVEGYSAFGSYEGNGSASGPFVFTGFKPRWIAIKNVDNYGTGYDWFIFDTTRDTYNVAENTLKSNLSDAETDSDSLDILSNGFKIRTTTNGLNLNAHTHIYVAFAEHPQKTARAR